MFLKQFNVYSFISGIGISFVFLRQTHNCTVKNFQVRLLVNITRDLSGLGTTSYLFFMLFDKRFFQDLSKKNRVMNVRLMYLSEINDNLTVRRHNFMFSLVQS